MRGSSKDSIAITKQPFQQLRRALTFDEGILATVLEPILILDGNLKIIWANNSFYDFFAMKPQETLDKVIYEISDTQWDVPKLKELLREIVINNISFDNFEVERDFPRIGPHTIILKARRIHQGETKTNRILLEIEDVTKRTLIERANASSELRYRRLFETAQDGILILDADSGQITDVNPFLIDMLGYSKDEFLGKRLWEIGAFIDARKSREVYKELIANHYVRYEDLPLETKDGRKREVEFVSNTYLVGSQKVIQCNIRDISARKLLERNLSFAATHDVLTDLPNRALFKDHYFLALAAAKRYHKNLAIMMLDIDYFKNINDSLGHQCGDQLLKAFGARLSACVRETDTVSRVGGDEFALLLTEVGDMKVVDRVAQKILQAIRKPFNLDNNEVRITTSIGISKYPDDGEDVEVLLKYADTAMYQAKQNGRDNYFLYIPSSGT